MRSGAEIEKAKFSTPLCAEAEAGVRQVLKRVSVDIPPEQQLGAADVAKMHLNRAFP